KIARTRLGDFTPLINLGWFEKASQVLDFCEGVATESGDVHQHREVRALRAVLRSYQGDVAGAVLEAEAALRLAYEGRAVVPIAEAHDDLAVHLRSAGADERERLAHATAAAVIYHLIADAQAFDRTIDRLCRDAASMESPPLVTSISELVGSSTRI